MNTADEKEKRKRRREGLLIVIITLVVITLTIGESRFIRQDTLISASGSNILIFGLININIILIILLLFLIIRNVVKLIYERRHGIIGSRIRVKLVVAFVSLSLIPAAVLFLVAVNILSYSVENWFSLKVGDALNQTMELAQLSYRQTEDYAKFYARQISQEISENRLYERERFPYLTVLLKQRQKAHNLGMVEVYLDGGRGRISIPTPNETNIPLTSLNPKMQEDLVSGKEISTIQPAQAGDIIRGLAPIYSAVSPGEVLGAVIVSYALPHSIVDKLSVISRTAEDYRQMKLLKTPIKISFVITLLLVTLVVIFSATWFGLFLAKGITNPIQDLGEAMRRIASGDMTAQISIEAQDEMGILVDQFNAMTRDLNKIKENLEQANIDLEQRRKYMEIVLKNVSAGVIAVTKDDVISIVNRAAERMMNVKAEQIINRHYQEVLSPEHMALVKDMLKALKESDTGSVERQIVLNIQGRTATFLVTTTEIKDDEGNYMGLVLVFEDLTELQRAERAAAWREVARRMAHEIKNPLTPIQLSAQRLQRKFGATLGTEGEVFNECTQTIINQVEVLKNLVNAFSRYAKLPTTKLSLNDLNEVISDAVNLFQEAHRDIKFTLAKDESLPPINLDPEQIKRVMINLLDNAVAAVANPGGEIEVRTIYSRNHQRAVVEVADNGCGVPPEYKAKIFEPYFSTKGAGSGLGLAIVTSIIEDHHGQISILENHPQGTIVRFVLPIPEGEETVRMYA
ncbi:MAG TPA: ATP-binding protein [Syntrophales bacterium]|nr:ATP-binding protein [Syntrophales bacterium]HOL59550.1 ATP-binding protein [Syntrophales bacterium]HPO35640.1 ATP-binding protein [Syntrophales bacterium]